MLGYATYMCNVCTSRSLFVGANVKLHAKAAQVLSSHPGQMYVLCWKHSSLLLLSSSLVPHVMHYSTARFTAGTFLPLRAQQLIISIHMFWNGSLWPSVHRLINSHEIKSETHAIAHTSHCGVCKCENAATVVRKLSRFGKSGSLPQALVGIYYTGMFGLHWWNYTFWVLLLSIKQTWLSSVLRLPAQIIMDIMVMALGNFYRFLTGLTWCSTSTSA